MVPRNFVTPLPITFHATHPTPTQTQPLLIFLVSMISTLSYYRLILRLLMADIALGVVTHPLRLHMPAHSVNSLVTMSLRISVNLDVSSVPRVFGLRLIPYSALKCPLFGRAVWPFLTFLQVAPKVNSAW